VRDLTVVRGYAKHAVDLPGASYVDNDAYATTGELASLAAARDVLDGACVVAYGDVLVKKYVLEELLDAEGDFVVAIDSLSARTGEWADMLDARADPRRADWAICSEAHSRKNLFRDVFLEDVVTDPTTRDVHGEWTGLLKLSARGAMVVRQHLETIDPANDSMTDLLRRLVRAGEKVRVVYSRGGWLDVDTLADVVKGTSFQ
jgi:phosphoenolpyruvate phosphomutase